MVNLAIIVIYLVAVAVVGIVGSRRARGLDDFFVAGRKGSPFFITGSLVATIIGGSATVGMAGLGFSRGLTGAWWLLAGTIGLVFLGVFLAKKVRNYGVYTLPQLAEKQYDSRIALASSILIVVAWVGVVAGQIIAAGTILSVLGIGSPLLWMVITTVVFITYTVLGGQRAVIRTDVLQSFIIFAGIFTGLALVMSRVGGMSGLESLLPADRFAFPVSDKFGGLDLVKLLLLVGLTYVVGPDMYSRLFSAKDSKTAKSSALWAAVILIPFALGITFIGMGASAILPGITPEQAFPAIVKEVLPPVASGLVLAALLCAVMSSADTTLLSASTILTVNIIGRYKPSLGKERTMAISRWAIVIFGLVALALALLLKGVINALLFAYTIYTAGVILPVLTGFYREKLRLTSEGALAAIIGGGVVGLISKIAGIQNLDLGALGVSLFLLFFVSFIARKVKARKSAQAKA